MGSHKSRVKGKNHLPRPDGHDSFYAAQDIVGFVGCKNTLPVHVQFFNHLSPGFIWDRVNFQLLLIIQDIFCFSHHPTSKKAEGAHEVGRGHSQDS